MIKLASFYLRNVVGDIVLTQHCVPAGNARGRGAYFRCQFQETSCFSEHCCLLFCFIFILLCHLSRFLYSRLQPPDLRVKISAARWFMHHPHYFIFNRNSPLPQFLSLIQKLSTSSYQFIACICPYLTTQGAGYLCKKLRHK